jgi:hypothetical protein
MKRVRELLDSWKSELKHDDGSTLKYSIAVITELKAAIAPDWHPASEPPDDDREVWVYCNDICQCLLAKWDNSVEEFVCEDEYGGEDPVFPTHWHEIEVPEPPEVGT